MQHIKRLLKLPIKIFRSYFRGFYQKYFSEVGYITREFNFLLNKIYFKDEINFRRSIKLKPILNDLQIVEDLNEFGYVKLKLADLGIDDSLRKYCDAIANEYNSKTLRDIKILRKFSYKNYWINIYKPRTGFEDPIFSLVCNSRVLSIASNYLGACPYAQELNFYYSPAGEGDVNKLIASQQWHLDNDKKRRLKIFYSPYSISSSNGPTTVLPAHTTKRLKYPSYPGYFNDCDLLRAGINFSDERIEFIANPDELYIADTSRCFHYGSRGNTDPRFMLIVGLGLIESHLNCHQIKNEIANKYGLENLNEKITSIAGMKFNAKGAL